MNNYSVIGLDLAKKKFHYAGMNTKKEVILKESAYRDDFFSKLTKKFKPGSTFAFEACGGSNYVAQQLEKQGYEIIMLKPKDVKPYAKSKQKNDINDSIAICKAALDPELMRVHPKSKYEQEISYLHKSRQNTIQQRIQRSNALMTSLFEFGYIVDCGKSKFAKACKIILEVAFEQKYINKRVYDQMLLDCNEIEQLLVREKNLDKDIIEQNKKSKKAQLLETIPGIGPINASILSIKPVGLYESGKEFSASLGLVPKQNTTGGNISLGGITKQGDRYARTMLIQAGRSILMRTYKPNVPKNELYEFAEKLKGNNKPFNVIAVALANKLARVAYACLTKDIEYINSK